MKIVDGDSHLIEPLNLYLQYIEPAYRERAMHVEQDSASGKLRMVVDNKSMRLGSEIDEMLSIVVGYGQKEDGSALNEFDQSLYEGGAWQDMDKRMQFLDAEGIDHQVLYPTLGLLWEGEVQDPQLAAALCRAYNTWAFEISAGHRDRLFPAAHISLREPTLAVQEIQRDGQTWRAFNHDRLRAYQRAKLRPPGLRSALGSRPGLQYRRQHPPGGQQGVSRQRLV